MRACVGIVGSCGILKLRKSGVKKQRSREKDGVLAEKIACKPVGATSPSQRHIPKGLEKVRNIVSLFGQRKGVGVRVGSVRP